jgi:hypothetical protein
VDRSENLERFYDDYRDYVRDVLQPNAEVLRKVLHEWRNPAHWPREVVDPDEGPNGPETPEDAERLPDPSPLQRRPSVRIKRPERVADKISRKAKEERYQAGLVSESFIAMDDALGARVVVYFLNQLPLVDGQIRGPDSAFELNPADPPVAYLPHEVLEDSG